MTLEEALNPAITLEDINTGKSNFWELSSHQIDLAVLAELLRENTDLQEEFKNIT